MRDRTALMWVSCLSSLSSASSSSNVTRLALKRDFFGGAGVKEGSWSGRSTAITDITTWNFGLRIKFCHFNGGYSDVIMAKKHTVYGDHIPLTCPVLSELSSFSFCPSTDTSLPSPLVRTTNHICSRRCTWAQELLLLPQKVCFRVSWLGATQHSSVEHIFIIFQ